MAARAAFGERLQTAMRKAGSLVCVGLDPDLDRFPAHLRDDPDAILRFNTAIIDATRDLVCAYKPNLGHYLAHGAAGIAALAATRALIPAGIPVILDCKVNDMASTAAAYARGYFDTLDVDAVTANPFLGEEALAPFLSRPDRGVILLSKTSNPGSGEFQDLLVRGEHGDTPLYLTIAERAAAWSERSAATIGLVVGATYPAQLAEVRRRCPALPILLPGIGAQGGDLEASLAAGLDAEGAGLIVSASRSILYASEGPDFADRARDATLQLRDAIRTAAEGVRPTA
jgi:orotidine-5'-phosphate decarboxylase